MSQLQYGRTMILEYLVDGLDRIQSDAFNDRVCKERVLDIA